MRRLLARWSIACRVALGCAVAVGLGGLLVAAVGGLSTPEGAATFAPIALATVGGLLASWALAFFLPSTAVLAPLSLFTICAACLGLYVTAGWLHSGTGVRGLLDLAMAPAYVAWKVALAVRGKATGKPQTWVRTTREGETRP